jgi:hypothetical protein
LQHRAVLFATLIALSCSLISCGPTRYIKPLEEGKTRLQVSSGVMPIGQSSGESGNLSFLAFLGGASVGVGHGITEDLTGWAAIYPGAFFTRAIYGEIGVLAGVLNPKAEGFGVSVSPRMHLSAQFADHPAGSGVVNFMPQVDANIYYDFTKIRPHAGVSMLMPFKQNDRSFRMTPTLQFGTTLKARSTDLILEFKLGVQTIDGSANFLDGIYGLSLSINGH